MTNKGENLSLEEIVIAWDVISICKHLKIPVGSSIEYILHLLLYAKHGESFDKLHCSLMKSWTREQGLNLGIANQIMQQAAKGNYFL